METCIRIRERILFMEKTQKKDMSPVRDMTSGNPLSLILAFAVPMLMGTLFQQFYSMVGYDHCGEISRR